MAFQTGPDAPLKPVKIIIVPEAPIESYVTFKVDGADEAFSTWKMELTDKDGTVQNFGPYTQEEVSISGNTILGTNPEGDYKVKMIGTNKIGEIVTKISTVHIVAWTPSIIEEGMRFSIIYEFDDAKAIAMYNKYLSEVVAPKIPATFKITSLGEVHPFNFPVNLTPINWGIFNSHGNPAITSTASAPPIPIATIPNPPALTVCESVPIIIPPGNA